ncbi:MAG: cob(I)yrinic acid a,c-diamide adenosyltransferase [bacterium]|nr:cob(I)yrinic acid a,c-diamide adenosyltransferase [bacterium]
MALYTGKGDGGTTKLFKTPRGKRESKAQPVFEALGTVDELNACVGWCRAGCTVDWFIKGTRISAVLLDVQHHLFTIQAELAGAGKAIPEEHVSTLEALIKNIEEELPEIKTFFVPGGTELSARLDVARTVTRRAERRLVALSEGGMELSPHTLAYANRLSSLLYALVRLVNERTGTEEQPPEYAE